MGGRLRMHYVDEGPRDGPLVLCLHGQPVWSYSFRKMVPLLAEAGHRVIAPDLVGFGRSDKPAERSDYTYARHVHWMQEFILDLDLTEITFVIHDWGGLIGLRVLTQNLERFDRVVACNMGLHDLKDVPMEQGPALRKLLEETPALSAEEMIRTGEETTRRMMAASDSEGGTKRSVFFRVFMYWVRHCGAFAGFRPEEIVRRWLKNPTDEDTRAYAAPFPSEEYLQGARQFPEPGADLSRRPGDSRQSPRLGDPANVREAVSHRVQQPELNRSTPIPAGNSWSEGPESRRLREFRALPPG